jgi:hypothetical protein
MHQAQQHFNEVCPALLKQEEGWATKIKKLRKAEFTLRSFADLESS